jgi:hypothetical protein
MEVSCRVHNSVALTPEKEPPGTQYTGGWVGPRAGLDVVVKRRNPFPCYEWNLHRPSRSLVTKLIALHKL